MLETIEEIEAKERALLKRRIAQKSILREPNLYMPRNPQVKGGIFYSEAFTWPNNSEFRNAHNDYLMFGEDIKKQIEENKNARNTNLYTHEDRIDLYITINRKKYRYVYKDYFGEITAFTRKDNNIYLDGCGYTFYMSLPEEYRKLVIDKCGFYLKGMAERLCADALESNDDSSFREFLKLCLCSNKIEDEDCIKIIESRKLDSDKAKEYYNEIYETAPHRYKTELWLLLKIDDVEFILEKIEQLAKDISSEQKAYLKLDISPKYNYHGQDSEKLYLLLASHIIKCTASNYTDSNGIGASDNKEVLDNICRYLKALGDLTYENTCYSLEVISNFEGDSYVQLLEGSGIPSSSMIEWNSSNYYWHPLFPVYFYVKRMFSRGKLSDDSLARVIKYVAMIEDKEELINLVKGKENIMLAIKEANERDGIRLLKCVRNRFSDEEIVSILCSFFSDDELIMQFYNSIREEDRMTAPVILSKLVGKVTDPLFQYELFCNSFGAVGCYLKEPGGELVFVKKGDMNLS